MYLWRNTFSSLFSPNGLLSSVWRLTNQSRHQRKRSYTTPWRNTFTFSIRIPRSARYFIENSQFCTYHPKNLEIELLNTRTLIISNMIWTLSFPDYLTKESQWLTPLTTKKKKKKIFFFFIFYFFYCFFMLSHPLTYLYYSFWINSLYSIFYFKFFFYLFFSLFLEGKKKKKYFRSNFFLHCIFYEYLL
jgi:hypothetical protein